MNAEVIHKTRDVYGIARDLPLNYVVRDGVDAVLIESLSRDKHIVIYGSSKQGKTSLRKHCLADDDYIIVHCSNKWALGDLHSAVLKKAGFEVTQSTTRTVAGKNKINAEFKAGILGADIKVGGEKGNDNEEKVVVEKLELDVEDVNDVIAALKSIGFQKFVVLEDFHYLTVETQRDFSVALKAFHEESKLVFIIVGVWLEENRLAVYNGDLTGRLIPIDADEWKADELKEVIQAGEALLNIQFSDKFREALIAACFESVYIVQEVCYELCMEHKISETVKGDLKYIDAEAEVERLVKRVVSQQGGRYNAFLGQFADGFQATELEMYKWLLYPVLISSAEDLERGLRLADIRKMVCSKHPQGKNLNTGNLTQALQFAASLQVKKEIKPIILDYDQTNVRLNVVDRGFLIWLSSQDRKELLGNVGLPTD